MTQIETRTGNKIGLIGGLALRAGVFYYEQILQRYNQRKQPLELVLSHADVNKVLECVMAGDKAALGYYLGTLANELFDAGAAQVAVTAIAPHLAIKELSAVARGPITNVLDCIAAGLKTTGWKRVGIFGNRAVIETNIFGTLPDDMVVKLTPARVNEVHTMYNDIALYGKRGTPTETKFLDMVARELIDRGADAILLAGTDLSSFYAERAPEFPHLDLAQLHIDQIVNRRDESKSEP